MRITPSLTRLAAVGTGTSLILGLQNLDRQNNRHFPDHIVQSTENTVQSFLAGRNLNRMLFARELIPDERDLLSAMGLVENEPLTQKKGCRNRK